MAKQTIFYFATIVLFLKVCLMSRDEQSILVVSYAELKHCLEQSFDEIATAASSDETIS